MQYHPASYHVMIEPNYCVVGKFPLLSTNKHMPLIPHNGNLLLYRRDKICAVEQPLGAFSVWLGESTVNDV